MKNHVRILLAGVALLLLVGWLGLRRSNAELATRLASGGVAAEAK